MAAKPTPRFRDLPDVDWPSFANGEVPVYNSATGKLEGQAQSGGGGGAPSGPAGGDLAGTYPNPSIGVGVIVNADVNASAAIAEAKLDLAPKVPANAGGYARGGPQDLEDPIGYLGNPTNHYLNAFKGDGEGGASLTAYAITEDTTGEATGAINAVAVANNDSGSTSIGNLDVEWGVNGAGDVELVSPVYIAGYLYGTGDIDKITGIYVDDQYGPTGGEGANASCAQVRGVFVESQDNAKAQRAIAFHTSQVHAGPSVPPGGTRWALFAEGHAPSYTNGPVLILPDVGGGVTPTMPGTTDALVVGTAASNRNLVVEQSGTVLFATDTNLFRSAADTLKTDDSFHVGATFRHLGSSAGFYGVAAVARPAAYTQTYSTATRTVSNPGGLALTSNGTSANQVLVDVTTAAVADPTKINANFDDVAAQVNNLIADVANLKQVQNSIIDDDQLIGLKQ